MLCFICNRAEHEPTTHEFWATDDALAFAAAEPQGATPSMSAVETLDPREAVLA